VVAAAAAVDWYPLWLTDRRLGERFDDWARATFVIVSAWLWTHRWDPNVIAADAVVPVADLSHVHDWQTDMMAYSNTSADYAGCTDAPDPLTMMDCARRCHSMRSDSVVSVWALKLAPCCHQYLPAQPPRCRNCQLQKQIIRRLFQILKLTFSP